MKLRLLNASHQALCYPGCLVGYRLAHEVTTDPLFVQFLLDYMTQEAIPTLRPVPGVDLAQYANQLIERFSNPEVRDTVAPAVRQRIRPHSQVPPPGHQAAARHRSSLHPLGRRRGQLGALRRGHRRARRNVRDGLGELADDPRFTEVCSSILASLSERGVRRTFTDLDRYAAPSMASHDPAGLERKSP
jgi:mannitol 2-dehydrogenase